MLGSSWVAAQLAASQEGLGSMSEWVKFVLPYISLLLPYKLAQALTPLSCIREMACSNLGRNTENPDWFCSWFSSVPPSKFRDSFIHSSMALYPFVGPWPLLQFRNLFYTDGRTPWTSDQPVARPLPTHRTTQRINAHTDIHALSGIRTHDPSVRVSEDSSCRRPRGHRDRQIPR
jgi:hypothetical protein